MSAVLDRFDVDRPTAEADYGSLLAKLSSIRAVHLQGR